MGIALVIAKRCRPRILIEWLNGRAIGGQDAAKPPSGNQLHIRKVCEDLRDRPLIRIRTPFQILLLQGLDQLGESLRGAFLHLQGILPTHISQDALRVLLGSLFHGWITPERAQSGLARSINF